MGPAGVAGIVGPEAHLRHVQQALCHLASLDELFAIKTPQRKLRRFIRYHFSIYLNEPSFAKTFVLNGIFKYYCQNKLIRLYGTGDLISIPPDSGQLDCRCMSEFGCAVLPQAMQRRLEQ